jgi:hypothetical protein
LVPWAETCDLYIGCLSAEVFRLTKEKEKFYRNPDLYRWRHRADGFPALTSRVPLTTRKTVVCVTLWRQSPLCFSVADANKSNSKRCSGFGKVHRLNRLWGKFSFKRLFEPTEKFALSYPWRLIQLAPSYPWRLIQLAPNSVGA